MTKFTFSAASPYALTPQSNWSIGLYNHRSISPDGSDRLFAIDPKYNNRPDLHAYDLYGDAELYWVFMVRNMNLIRDPLWDHEAGKEIYFPTKERLRKVLGIS